MSQKRLIDKYYYQIVITALLFNIIIMTWSEPDDFFGSLWLMFCTIVMNGCVAIVVSNTTIKHLTKNLLHIPIALATAGLLAIILTYFQFALNLCLTEGLNYAAFNTHSRFYEQYLCELHFKSLFTWFIYYIVVYGVNCIWKLVPWERPLARKMGYVFTEDVAVRDDNTITFPRAFKYDSMKLYKTMDNRIIILPKDMCDEMFSRWNSKAIEEMTEDDKTFLEMLKFSTETEVIDKTKIKFELNDHLVFTSNNYEIIEHDGWYELIPLNLVDKNEDRTGCSQIFKGSIWIPLLGFLVITITILNICFDGYAFGPDELISDLKYISFLMLMIMTGQICNKCIINQRSSKSKKNITWATSSIFILMVIILLNNVYHYIPFCVQFDWPTDITYGMFLWDDLTYNIGLGGLRYPAIIGIYSIIFVIGYFKFVKRGIKALKRIIIEILSDEEESEE